MSDKAVFEKIEGYRYNVPVYSVMEGEGIKLVKDAYGNDSITPPTDIYIQMVRGSKIEGENKIAKQDGILVEQLLAVCIDHLEAVNTGELRSSHSDAAIDALKEAGLFLQAREEKRKKANVLGTYKN